MLTIVLIAVFLAVAGFLVFLGSFIASLAAHLSKNDKLKIKSRKVRAGGLICFGVCLIGVVALVYFKGSETANESLHGAGKFVGKFLGTGVSTAAQSFEQNWDSGRVEQMKNMTVTLGGVTSAPDGDNIVYEVEVVLNNQSPPDTKLYWADLIGNGQLAVCDSDDFVYTLSYNVSSSESREIIPDGDKTTRKESYEINSKTKIPFGKSRAYFLVTRPKDALPIDHLQYLGEQIY
ncbi:hypothetical protein AGMMS49975_22470 [Clostridia bacterium]|nr:hypothetical protein AGMMS49975_22470 [Clostridia bacterium]